MLLMVFLMLTILIFSGDTGSLEMMEFIQTRSGQNYCLETFHTYLLHSHIGHSFASCNMNTTLSSRNTVQQHNLILNPIPLTTSIPVINNNRPHYIIRSQGGRYSQYQYHLCHLIWDPAHLTQKLPHTRKSAF